MVEISPPRAYARVKRASKSTKNWQIGAVRGWFFASGGNFLARRHRRCRTGKNSTRGAVEDADRLGGRKKLPGAGSEDDIAGEDHTKDAQGSAHKFGVAQYRDPGQIEDRGQQRQVEHDGLGVTQ